MVTATRRLSFHFLFVVLLALAGCASPALRMAASPEEAGLSSQRLKEFSAAMQAKVDSGEIPGAVILIARGDRIAYLDAVGFRDREAKAPMTKDAIFRLASMTKPITTLAAMILVEEGKLKLSDPVSKYLLEFKHLQVGVERPGSDGKPQLATEPARQEMTVLDLMRHTSGITYGVFGKSLVKDRYNAAKLFDTWQTNSDFAIKLAGLPLQYQPGTRWDYSMSTDLLGSVIEVAAGQGLEQFMAARIFKPLKMNDTGFVVHLESRGRIAEPQVVAATGKRPAVWDVAQDHRWKPGGLGLASTAYDYARFCQMVLNGGILDGVRVVSRETIDLMRANHLPEGLPPVPDLPINVSWPSRENGMGFGLGFAVHTSEGVNKVPGSIGDLSWGGAFGTYFWIDPKERMAAIVMMQAPSNVNMPMRRFAREHVYGALR